MGKVMDTGTVQDLTCHVSTYMEEHHIAEIRMQLNNPS